MPEDFEEMWAGLLPLGRSAASGGYFRQAYGSAEREAHAWFLAQAASRGLRVEHDGNGNTLAWWDPAEGAGSGSAPGVLTGSHLDSVLDGGAFDGPLGVVSALAAIDRLRERGHRLARPLGVAVFAEEEGSRFGLACLGSRLAVGRIDPETVAGLRDRDGIAVPEAMARVGIDPVLGQAAWVGRVGCFVELHVEQGRGLVEVDAPVGVASGIWPHGRYRFDFAGEANHAGTTRMEDRHDPMLTFAMTALAANKQARLGGTRATFGRVEVTPNGTNAVPARVTAWLDARAADPGDLDGLVATLGRMARDRAARDGTAVEVVAESVSPAVAFDEELAARIGPTLPRLATAAGHDAGILAAAGIPTAMLFVRNPTGVSHSPSESARLEDCLTGVDALADALAELSGEG